MRKLRFECFGSRLPSDDAVWTEQDVSSETSPCALVKQAFGSRGEGGELVCGEFSSPPESPSKRPTAYSAWLVYCLPHGAGTISRAGENPGSLSGSLNAWLRAPLQHVFAERLGQGDTFHLIMFKGSSINLRHRMRGTGGSFVP